MGIHSIHRFFTWPVPFYLRGYCQAKKRGWLVLKRGWLVFKRGWLASVFKRSGQAKGKSVEIKVSSQTEGFSAAQKTLIQLRPAREGNRVTETKTGSKSPNWLTSVQARISLRIRLNAWQSLCTSSEGQRVDLSSKVEEGGDWSYSQQIPIECIPLPNPVGVLCESRSGIIWRVEAWSDGENTKSPLCRFWIHSYQGPILKCQPSW